LLGETRPVVVFGAMADKDVSFMLSELRRMRPRCVVFTAAASAGSRAAPPSELASAWGAGAEVSTNAFEALQLARELAGAEGWVVVCGSIYLVGELREPF
jgi:dihydrofolate synthase/folylpolyglutamate synthase